MRGRVKWQNVTIEKREGGLGVLFHKILCKDIRTESTLDVGIWENKMESGFHGIHSIVLYSVVPSPNRHMPIALFSHGWVHYILKLPVVYTLPAKNALFNACIFLHCHNHLKTTILIHY